MFADMYMDGIQGYCFKLSTLIPMQTWIQPRYNIKLPGTLNPEL